MKRTTTTFCRLLLTIAAWNVPMRFWSALKSTAFAVSDGQVPYFFFPIFLPSYPFQHITFLAYYNYINYHNYHHFFFSCNRCTWSYWVRARIWSPGFVPGSSAQPVRFPLPAGVDPSSHHARNHSPGQELRSWHLHSSGTRPLLAAKLSFDNKLATVYVPSFVQHEQGNIQVDII